MSSTRNEKASLMICVLDAVVRGREATNPLGLIKRHDLVHVSEDPFQASAETYPVRA